MFSFTLSLNSNTPWQGIPLHPGDKMQKERDENMGGRPRKEPDQLRSRVVSVRLTELEYLSVLEDAGKLRQKPGIFLRNAVLGRQLKAVPAINRESWTTLGKFCGRLNQIMADKGRGDTSFVHISLDEFRAMKELVVKLRQELKA